VEQVVTKKSEPRCKLCRSPQRAAIDLLLLRRSRGDVDGDGVKITGDYLLEKFAQMGVENPTKDNLTVHFGKHCEVVQAEERQANADELDDVFGELLSGAGTDIDVDASLRAVFKIGVKDLAAQYRNGTLKIGISELRQIADTLERRRKTDAESDLMRTFGRAMEGAMAAYVMEAPRPHGEIVEGEAIEEGEVRELEAG
jgi:hypothetical protein